MGDSTREYLRAAQQAETRGDKNEAVELLKQAAWMYRSTGRLQRAIQMLRQALRVDPSRPDVQEELKLIEASAEIQAAPLGGPGIEERPTLSYDALKTRRGASVPPPIPDRPPSAATASAIADFIADGPTHPNA